MSEVKDGLEVLSRVSGIPKKEVNEIWQRVKENKARLDSCELPHDFYPINENGRLPRKAVCKECLGVVDITNARFYIQGLRDAKQG